MKILIKVTKEILSKTRLCTSNYGINCAIAEAVREILPYAITMADSIRIYSEKCFKKWYEREILLYDLPTSKPLESIQLPPNAILFISIFDESQPEERVIMEPFSFEIDIPMDVIEQIGISEAYKILSESRTLELVSIN